MAHFAFRTVASRRPLRVPAAPSAWGHCPATRRAPLALFPPRCPSRRRRRHCAQPDLGPLVLCGCELGALSVHREVWKSV